MPRSHPPTLLKLTERTLREECDVQRGERLLVAVSGGPDSIALLHVLAWLRNKLAFGLFAHGVDHGLRPEAAEELNLAARLARELDVPFDRTCLAIRRGGNLQARARDARYQALKKAASRHRCTRLATAHHGDDRAETVMIRLLQGSGPGGLAVLPPADGPRIRPFVRARRRDVLLHLVRHGLSSAEDPSNLDRRFLRVRVRLELMPLLETLSPRVVDHLNALADALGDETTIPPLTDESGARLPLKRAHIQAVKRALKSGQRQARVSLPGGRAILVNPLTGRIGLEGTSRGGAESCEIYSRAVDRRSFGGAKTPKRG